MLTEDKIQNEITWWENLQSHLMRIFYFFLSLPIFTWILSKLNQENLGDPFSAGYWIKIALGFSAVIFFLILPIIVQQKLSKLRTPVEANILKMKLKPFPVESPVYIFLVSIIFFPFSITYPWVGICVLLIDIALSEFFLYKKNLK